MVAELRDCSFGYEGRPVVRVDGSVRLDAGRCLGLYGPNGAGKTTLVRGLLGLLAPLSGSVRRDERVVRGYLPQHRAVELHWPMTALDATAMAASARRRFGWTFGLRTRLREAMDRLGVAELAERPFGAISGGQQQRVLLAGALSDRPGLLVLDEPTDGLDTASRDLLLRVLREEMQAGLAAVIVSHDAGDLGALCDSVLHLEPADEPGRPSVAHAVPAEAFHGRLVSPGRQVPS